MHLNWRYPSPNNLLCYSRITCARHRNISSIESFQKMNGFKRKAAHGTFRKRKYDVAMLLLAVLLPVVLLEVMAASTATFFAEMDNSPMDGLVSGTN